LSAFEYYFGQIPARLQSEVSDITLFDHLRITAAIAEGLYYYHCQSGQLSDTANFFDTQVEKWRLVCGDFSGIQHFIFTLTSKNAAKGLRGRSLFIQLLCDVSAQFLLRKMKLMPTSLVYSSGGKFYCLIPNTQLHQDRLQEGVNVINDWLLEEYRGEMVLGVGSAPVSAEYFEAGKMGTKWKEVQEKLQQDRLIRFQSQISDSPNQFFRPKITGNSVCRACSRTDANIQLRDDVMKCEQCHRLETLGRNIARASWFLWLWGDDQQIAQQYSKSNEFYYSFNELGCTLCFLEERPDFLFECFSTRPNCDYFFEQINAPCPGGFRFIGKWDTQKKEIKEFDDFASKSIGIDRMAVLRMDVDNLGEIFVRGLNYTSANELGSLSRIATLSRQLHVFFAGYLNVLMESFKRSQIIYSGGDDLFIIGSWDEIPDVACKIQHTFEQYCANNPIFSLSGGIVLVTGKYPIYRSADLAGEAESRAKQIDPQKKALCFLGTVIGWEDFQKMIDLKNQIERIIKKMKNKAILDHLKHVVYFVENQKKMMQAPVISNAKLHAIVTYQQWRWQFIYQMNRMKKRVSNEVANDLDQLTNSILGIDQKMRRPFVDWLAMPVRWVELLREGNTNEKGKKI